MENKTEDLQEKPPFFKNWRGLYTFILLFELALILLFIFITNTYQA